jgi:hypothetical protein
MPKMRMEGQRHAASLLMAGISQSERQSSGSSLRRNLALFRGYSAIRQVLRLAATVALSLVVSQQAL